MKILIDMNLSPDWVTAFTAENIEAVHWMIVGSPQAEDTEIMDYARANDFVVFTQDLDFGTILALTQAESPSVVQLRAQNILPAYLGQTVITVFREHQEILEQGALLVIDERRARVRILPLERRP